MLILTTTKENSYDLHWLQKAVAHKQAGKYKILEGINFMGTRAESTNGKHIIYVVTKGQFLEYEPGIYIINNGRKLNKRAKEYSATKVDGTIPDMDRVLAGYLEPVPVAILELSQKDLPEFDIADAETFGIENCKRVVTLHFGDNSIVLNEKQFLDAISMPTKSKQIILEFRGRTKPLIVKSGDDNPRHVAIITAFHPDRIRKS